MHCECKMFKHRRLVLPPEPFLFICSVSITFEKNDFCCDLYSGDRLTAMDMEGSSFSDRRQVCQLKNPSNTRLSIGFIITSSSWSSCLRPFLPGTCVMISCKPRIFLQKPQWSVNLPNYFSRFSGNSRLTSRAQLSEWCLQRPSQ